MIHTVRGKIHKKDMGMTLGHEHFNWIEDKLFTSSMYFERVYDQAYNKIKFNQLMPILEGLKEVQCQSIVEASPPLGGQNLKLLYDLSKESKINIIPCTGISVTKFAYDIFKEGFVDQLSKRWISDFENGLDTIDGICIKPAYIKLLLDEGPLSDVDQAMVRAAAIASNKTGMPIHCHILEANRVAPVLKILKDMEVAPNKFLWAHADKEGNLEVILKVINQGYWVGFDMIKEGSHENRKTLIDHAIKNNYTDQVLLSQDYDFYEELEGQYPIETCRSLFTQFIPYCIGQGISKKILEKIMTDNPGKFYDL